MSGNWVPVTVKVAMKYEPFVLLFTGETRNGDVSMFAVYCQSFDNITSNKKNCRKIYHKYG